MEPGVARQLRVTEDGWFTDLHWQERAINKREKEPNLGGTRYATADGPPRGSPGTIES